MKVTDFDPATGNLFLKYQLACGATDHHIEYGPLADVGTYGYSGQECGIGASGTYGPFNPGHGEVFFLIVGNDAAGTEGSYGQARVGGLPLERPADTLDLVCSFTQDLSARCDLTGNAAVEMTAFRPQSETYGMPLQRTAVPELTLFVNRGDADILDLFRNDTAQELQINLAGAVITNGQPEIYRMDMLWPEIHFTAAEDVVIDNKVAFRMTVGEDGVFQKAGSEYFQVTVTNTTAAYLVAA